MSRLIVGVGMLPLGSTTLLLSAADAGSDSLVAISSVEIADPTSHAGFEIANAAWSLRLSRAGLLQQATEQSLRAKRAAPRTAQARAGVEEKLGGESPDRVSRENFTLNLHQDIAVYWGNSGISVSGDGGVPLSLSLSLSL
eukprot:COSAG03_NODE_10514_length_646_cov_0.521024_1_plen_140_part_10